MIIGGGAAGFFGAIACAEANPQTQVTLLEASRQALTKVRISGGGRCNVTHACFDSGLLVSHYPRGGKALRGAFSRFQPRDTVHWFNQRGVTLKTEADGRMFPVTDDSATIADCLMHAAHQAGVNIRLDAPVRSVDRADDGFRIILKSGEQVCCDRLLLATGSSPTGYRLAQSLGHSIEAPVPSLFTFKVADADLHARAGVSLDPVRGRLVISGHKPVEQTGALLITHWGFSGPVVLKLSAWGARLLHQQRYRATFEINWLPQHSTDQVQQIISNARTETSRRAIASHCPLPLPRRLWQYLLQRSGTLQQVDIDEQRWANLSKKSAHQLVQELVRSQYPVVGKGVFKEEFVTCGGIRLKEVNFKTMASRCCPGLYVAGEILDIDGVTGGFNFQSAWTTGWLAGKAMGSEISEG